jgi:peptidoglycan LD-endopeptidase CwlK
MAIKLADKTPTLQSLLDRADKKLANVHPTLKTKAVELIKRAYAQGIYVLITQGFRSIAEQNELYAQGRTKPGKIVTNAKGGYSYHNFGLAFDIVIQNADGSLCWSVADKRWQTVGAIGKSLGLEWGGEWRDFSDYPHFQLTFGLSLADLRAGKRPPQPQAKPAQPTKQKAPTISKEVAKLEAKQSAYELELEKAVEWAKKNGVSNGERLNEPATRAQVLLMLYRALGGGK